MRNIERKKKMRKYKLLILTLCILLTVSMTAGQLVFAAEDGSGPTVSQQAQLKAPTSVKALSSGQTSIKVSWKKVSGAEKYQVYRYYSKSDSWKKVRTTTKTETTFTGLSKNTTYRYKVRAVRGESVSAFCREVSAKTGVVTKISLSRKIKSLYGSDTFTLEATVTAKAPSKEVRWSSADKSIATVSASGKVTAKGKGIVKITAKAHNGATASCLVTVGTEFDKKYQQEILRLVNKLRAENGLKPVKYAYNIQAATDVRAQEAWAYKSMGHHRYTKNGTTADFDSVYTDLGLKLSYGGTGENLAWRTDSYSDPVQAAQVYFNQWKNSAPHRANILHKNAKSMAVTYMYQRGQEFPGVSAQLFLM